MKKRILSLFLLSITALALTACGGNQSSENGEVIVYNWGEYIDPDVLTSFE